MLQATAEDVRGRTFSNAELRAIARRAGPEIAGRSRNVPASLG